MNQNAKKRNKSLRKTERKVVNAIGQDLAKKLSPPGKPKRKARNRIAKRRSDGVGMSSLVDSSYSLAVAFPESSVEGRVPDDSLTTTSALTVRMRTSVTSSVAGSVVFAVNPALKNHINVGVVNDATSAITWTLADHEDYSTLAANFARYRPVGLAVRIVRGSSSLLNSSGEVGSVQVSGTSTSAYPTAAGSFTTITNYESESVLSLPTAVAAGGYRRVWIPQEVPSDYSISIDDTNAALYGCSSRGTLVFYGRGLPTTETLIFETYLKFEAFPYGDTSYLFPGKAAVADQGGLQRALLNVASWLASAGNTVNGAVKTMEQMSVMTALNRAGALIGRTVGIGAGSTLEERVVARLLAEGRLTDMVNKLSLQQPTNPDERKAEEQAFLSRNPLGAQDYGSEASYQTVHSRGPPEVTFEPRLAPTVMRRS